MFVCNRWIMQRHFFENLTWFWDGLYQQHSHDAKSLSKCCGKRHYIKDIDKFDKFLTPPPSKKCRCLKWMVPQSIICLPLIGKGLAYWPKTCLSFVFVSHILLPSLYESTSVRQKPLYWFRSDTNTETQIGWYFWANIITETETRFQVEIQSPIFSIIKGPLKPNSLPITKYL